MPSVLHHLLKGKEIAVILSNDDEYVGRVYSIANFRFKGSLIVIYNASAILASNPWKFKCKTFGNEI